MRAYEIAAEGLLAGDPDDPMSVRRALLLPRETAERSVALALACEFSTLLDRIRVRKPVDMDNDDAGRKRVLDEIAEIEERIIRSFRSADRLAELRSMPYREYLKTPEWGSRRGEALGPRGQSLPDL